MKKLIYEEINWLIDMYSSDLTEYSKFIRILDSSINDYRQMVGELPLDIKETTEEVVR